MAVRLGIRRLMVRVGVSVVMALSLAMFSGRASAEVLQADQSVQCGDTLDSNDGAYSMYCGLVYSLTLNAWTYAVRWTGASSWSSAWDASWTSGIEWGGRENQYSYAPWESTMYMQSDGNFVFNGSGFGTVWSTRTASWSNAYLNAQNDGNLVVYNQFNYPLWSVW
jgi:hypothetical protein